MKKRKFICVFFSKASAWRAKGHTHWFVCQKCLRKIAQGEPDWTPPPDVQEDQVNVRSTTRTK